MNQFLYFSSFSRQRIIEKMRGDPPRRVLDGSPPRGHKNNGSRARNGRSQDRPRKAKNYEKSNRSRYQNRSIDVDEKPAGQKMGTLGDFKVTISNNRDADQVTGLCQKIATRRQFIKNVEKKSDQYVETRKITRPKITCRTFTVAGGIA